MNSEVEQMYSTLILLVLLTRASGRIRLLFRVEYLPVKASKFDHINIYIVLQGLFVGESVKSNAESGNFCTLISIGAASIEVESYLVHCSSMLAKLKFNNLNK
jgi:hypothetical protein